MKLTFSRLVVALSAPMLGIKNVEVLAKFTLPAEDEPHEAVWLQVSFAIRFSINCGLDTYLIWRFCVRRNISGPMTMVGILGMLIDTRRVGFS